LNNISVSAFPWKLPYFQQSSSTCQQWLNSNIICSIWTRSKINS